MKRSKVTYYYFMFWILYLPFAVVLTLLLDYSLEAFFVAIGVGALVLLAFLTVHFLVYKRVLPPPLSPSTSEPPMPKEDFEAFRALFREKTGCTT